MLDKIRGTSHFDVSESEAVILMKVLRERLPGYLVPKLVREVPGEKHKMPLM
jgi:L-lysine 2,3-aminomutase